MEKHPIRGLIHDYKHDKSYRVELNTQAAMYANILAAVMYFYNGIAHSSIWFFFFFVYYVSLMLIRSSLIQGTYACRKETDQVKRQEKEKEVVQRTGVLLVLVNLAFCGVMIEMINHGYALVYPANLVFLVIVYTLVCIIAAVANSVHDRKGGLLLHTLRWLNLVACFVGIYILNAALLSAFADDWNYHKVFLSVSGAILFLALMYISGKVILLPDKNVKNRGKINKR